MHVDGFRFDLASALARELHEVDKLGAFFDIIHQDPVISQVKLIAEPWDLGEGGYMVGNFPVSGPSGTASTATACVRSGGRRRRRVRVRHAVLRQQRPVRMERTAAARQHQLRHLPRRFHAGGPGLVQRKAQRSQRRRTIRTARTTTSAGTAASKAPPDDREISPCAIARNVRFWPRSSSRRACRCCWPATKWATRRAATTTPTARTTKSPGSIGKPQSTNEIRQLLEFVRACSRSFTSNPCFTAASSSQAAPSAEPAPTSSGSIPTAPR
jgi:hypothetical protein